MHPLNVRNLVWGSYMRYLILGDNEDMSRRMINCEMKLSKLDVILNDTNLEKLRKILFYEKQIREIAMEKQLRQHTVFP